MNFPALTLLRPFFWESKNRVKRAEKKDLWRLFFFAILALALVLGTYRMVYRVLFYFSSVELIGTLITERLLALVFLVFFSLLFISGFVTAIGIFYTSKDLLFIMTLPLDIKSIFRARFAQCLFAATWTLYLIFGTIFVALGVLNQAVFSYYIFTVLIVLLFTVIPVGLGTALCFLLISLLTAKKTRAIFVPLFFGVGVGLYLILRLIQPERLADPESYVGISRYMYELKAPLAVYLPSSWATQAVLAMINHDFMKAFLFAFVLAAGALFVFVIAEIIAGEVYKGSWIRSNLTGGRQKGEASKTGRYFGPYLSLFPKHCRNMVRKDLLLFFRNPAQWSQLLLLGALVVVYLYNYAFLPLDKTPLPTFYMQNLVSFLNIGITGFILAALTTRFIFPAVSMEGRGMWLLKSAPISLRDFLKYKYFGNLLPLLVFGLGLVYASSRFLYTSTLVMWISLVLTAILAAGLAAIGVCLGAIFPDFKSTNPAKASFSYGGIMCMVTSAMYVGTGVASAAWPTYILFMSQANKYEITPIMWVLIVLAAGIPFILTTFGISYLFKNADRALQKCHSF